MKNNSMKQLTPAQAQELVSQIVPSGDDTSARALTALINALASISDSETREAVAVAVAERAYLRTNEYGDALLAFLQGDTASLETARHSA